MRRTMNASMLMIIFFAGDVFAAGGGLGVKDDFSSSVNWIDGISVNSNFTNYSGDYASGGVGLGVDPERISIEWANWYFRVDKEDSSKWQITCFINGLYLPEEGYPKQRYLSSEITRGKVSVRESLDLFSYENNWESDIRILNLSGYFQVYPAIVTGSNFQFLEEERQIWDPQDGSFYSVPGWRAEYRANGYFVANTLAEAQAMGSQFLHAVPEPSSFQIMTLAGTFGFLFTIVSRVITYYRLRRF